MCNILSCAIFCSKSVYYTLNGSSMKSGFLQQSQQPKHKRSLAANDQYRDWASWHGSVVHEAATAVTATAVISICMTATVHEHAKDIRCKDQSSCFMNEPTGKLAD